MWMRDNEPYNGSNIVYNGKRIFNPSEDQLKEAGYVWVEPTPDTREWVNKELFVNAVYALVPAEAIPAVLADAETAAAVIANMALMTTAAAPGNSIDIADPRVEQWLAISGVTVEQVKDKMQELSIYG